MPIIPLVPTVMLFLAYLLTLPYFIMLTGAPLRRSWMKPVVAICQIVGMLCGSVGGVYYCIAEGNYLKSFLAIVGTIILSASTGWILGRSKLRQQQKGVR